MAEEPTDYPEKRVEIIEGAASVHSEKRESTKHTYTVTAENQVKIVDRTYFFPGWKVFVDGKETAVQFQDPAYAGMITFQVPAGTHEVTVEFQQSRLQQFSNIISISSILFLLVGAVFHKKIMKLVKNQRVNQFFITRE